MKGGEFLRNNKKIRTALEESRMRHWELADLLGISESTLVRKLRKELPEEEQKRIISIIKKGSVR